MAGADAKASDRHGRGNSQQSSFPQRQIARGRTGKSGQGDGRSRNLGRQKAGNETRQTEERFSTQLSFSNVEQVRAGFVPSLFQAKEQLQFEGPISLPSLTSLAREIPEG